jgi:arginine/lysine/ornithine decarboxylase
MTDAASEISKPETVKIPDPPKLELETVNRPRDAFFSQFEDVKAKDAVGRIAAEQITPYPPGIPAILPGERISQEVVDYLQSGVQAGMVLPDPVDPSLKTIRVMQ